MYYTTFFAEKQIKAHNVGLRTYFPDCSPHSRCKQIHKCATCHKQWQKKNLHKRFDHITDKKLTKYAHALYITVTPSTCTHDYEIPNANVDYLLDSLTNAGTKRCKAHPFHNSEYLTFKEITRSKSTGALLPHLHIVLLTDTIPVFNNPFFDFHIQPITIDLNPNYYNDYKNPITQTLKKIFMYSTKSDHSRINMERQSDLSHGKSDVRYSPLFKTPIRKSHNVFPIHILTRKISSNALKAKREALRLHSAYRSKHINPHGIAVHKHALKTQKKIKAIASKAQTLKKRLRDKLKRAKPRPPVAPTRTHTKKQT